MSKCCCAFKKIAKVVGIIMGIVAAIVAVYFAVTKIMEIFGKDDTAEDYVSCSCCDDEPIVIEEEN